MPVLKLLVKPDNTFLTQIIYEGILALIYYNRDKAETKIDHIELPHDAFRRLFELIKNDEKQYEKIINARIGFVGNDKKHKVPNRILAGLGISISGANINTYGDLARILIENYTRIPDVNDSVLTYSIHGGNLFIGKEKINVTAPQLFKIDRYTGYTTLDKDTTYQQFTLKASQTWALLGVIGVVSSYVSSFGNTHYFVFLSPDEIVELLVKSDPDYIYNVFSIKQKVMNRLRDILKAYVPEEVVILSTLLDLSLIYELRNNELDHISFQIYRVVVEGNTYKVYNTTALTIYSRPYYLDVIERMIRNSEKIVEILSEALSGRSVIIQALRSLAYDNVYPEANHVLSGIHELYRLITFGDPNGFYGFLRELETVCKVLEAKDDSASKARLKQYKRILNNISKYI